MNVQKRNDAAIYCLSSGSNLPEWLGDQAKRNLSKRDETVRRRIELLQDFQMPSSSSKLLQSPDSRFLIAAGSYPPRIRCYDVRDLSMKFERYLNAECIDMLMLSEDYGKMALLLEDRTISIQAPYGNHTSIRIPAFGRGFSYEPTTCELLVASKGNNVFRLNLAEGRFSEPWKLEREEKLESSKRCSATSIAVNSLYPLVTVGCDDGYVRFWDCRSSDKMLLPFLRLDVASVTKTYGFSNPNNDSQYSCQRSVVTSIAHDPSGMYMAFGTGSGVVALYDVRSSRPLHCQEHKQGLPIHTVKFHSGSGLVLSSDENMIKAWRYKESSAVTTQTPQHENDHSYLGTVKVNIEGDGRLKHFIVAGDTIDKNGSTSGLILCATDQPKMNSFFIPGIGPAPEWCGFLETITEELEERDLKRDGALNGHSNASESRTQETVFENYKFVSRNDLDKLGVSSLIGTPLLRGYMHGFFMDINLYNRVQAVVNPFEYEEYQKKKLANRLASKQASRINPRELHRNKIGRKASVNPSLIERLEIKANTSKKCAKAAGTLLEDNRFGTLFTNPDFEIDERNENFVLRNPSGVAAVKLHKNNLDSDDENNPDSDDENNPDNDDVNIQDARINFKEKSERGYSYDSIQMTVNEGDNLCRSANDRSENLEQKEKEESHLIRKQQNGKKIKKIPRFLHTQNQLYWPEVAAEVEIGNQPLFNRGSIGSGGSKEATFIPNNRLKGKNAA